MNSRLLFLLPWLLAGCAQNETPLKSGSKNDPIYRVKAEDARMNAAIARAKKELPTFIKILQSPGKDNRDFLVKAEFLADDGQRDEHLWFNKIQYDGKKFGATLINSPYWIKKMKIGDRVTIAPEKISDWQFTHLEKGKPFTVGGYTNRVLMEMEKEAK